MKLPSAIVVLLVLGYAGYSLHQHFGLSDEAPDELTDEERFLIEEAEREAARRKAEPVRVAKPAEPLETVSLEPLSSPELERATRLAREGDHEVARALADYRARLETVEIRAAAGRDALGLAAERKAGPELRGVVLEQLNAAKREANASRLALHALLEERQGRTR